MIPHCILEDDLVLYALGELEGERLEHLEAHVELCPECQKRIDQYRRLRRHLSGVTSTMDSSAQRDALKRRIQAEAGGPPVQRRKHGLRWQPAMALTLILVLAVTATVATTSDVEGRFPFARFVGLGPENSSVDIERYIADPGELPGVSVQENLQSSDTGLPVPDDRRVPEELPLGLFLVESYVRADGYVTHYFDSREYGLEIAVSVSAPETTRTSIPQERAMLAEVNGTEVLVDRERAQVANSVLWVDDDLLFNVRIVRASGGLTLTPEQLMSVAEAIMLDRDTTVDGA